MKKLNPEIIEKLKKDREEKAQEVQIPLYLPEGPDHSDSKEEITEKIDSRIITIDLVD